MKNFKLIWTILVTVLVTNFTFSQTITNANFANAIRNLYPTLIEANNNNLTPAALTYVGALDFSGWGNATNSSGTASAFAAQPKLTTLEGLQHFVQCKGIDVSNQLLTSLPALPNTIIFIKSNNNQLNSLPSSLPISLEYLRVSQNSLTQLPSLPSVLKALKCDNNLLTQLPNLPSGLAYLDVSFNTTLGCFPTIPNNLINNTLPSSILTNYVFSSDSNRRLDFSYTGIRCVPTFITNMWDSGKVSPIAPGVCSDTPQLKSSISGTEVGQSNGSIVVVGTLRSANAKIEYSLNNSVYGASNVFSNLGPGSYTIHARRKSEGTVCINPSSSITINVPIRNNQNIYVSPTGNDITGTGVEANPYKTIAKALSMTSAGSGATVRAASGIFIENQSLIVPSTVSIIGQGSKQTFIWVNVYEQHNFMIRLLGGSSILRGFSMDGQAKKCHAAVEGGFANNCTIDDLNIQNFKHTGILIQFADNTTISNCFIKNSTFGTTAGDNACIYIDGENILLKKNTIILNEDIGGYGIKDSFPIGQNVQFFQIPDLRREDEYALNVTMENNTVLVNPTGMWNNRQAPGFVFENFATCKNCVFRNNIFNGTMSLVDGGTTSYGYFYDGPRYNIYNNTFNLYDGGNTVESGSPDIEFHHNYIFGGGGLNSFGGNSSRLNYHHNVFFNQKGLYAISSWENPPAISFKFNNNIIVDHNGSFWLGHNNSNRNIEIKNNIFASVNPTLTSPIGNSLNALAGTNTVVSNNLYFNIVPYGQNSIVANPKFLGSGIKPYTYFQLQKDSPAIDAGLVIPGTTDGFKGSAPDLGAYEYGSNRAFNNSSSYSLGIGTINPESTSIIDIFSDSQGVLIPRLTLSKIQSMPSPAEGLLVFCADCLPSVFYYCDGSNWLKHQGGVVMGAINVETNTSKSSVFLGTTNPNKSAVFELSDASRGLLLPRLNSLDAILNPTEGLIVYLKNDSQKGIYFYNGKNWQKAFNGVVAFSINPNPSTFTGGGNIGINTSTPHHSSILDINFGTKGLLPPRLGKVQMESIKSPALGLMVYCHDCSSKGFYYNNGTNWQNTVVTVPTAPQNVVAVQEGTSVVVSFNPPVNNGGNDISSYTITSLPNNIVVNTINSSATFTGLIPGVAYIFMVTAHNKGGSSESVASNPILFGIPDMPFFVYALRGQAAGTADVYFSPPLQTGGSPIIDYTITAYPGKATFKTNQSPFTITGLTINTSYTFTITANNANGTSLPALTNAITSGQAITQTPKVLDNISGNPAVAFGLRQLKSSYKGPVIDVRRASDNQIISIGFDNQGNLNTGLILDFCGNSKGYVTRWYDQSGNGKDALNITLAAQPLIFNGLSLETVAGKPALNFTGSTVFLSTAQNVLANSNELATFTVAYASYYQNIIQHGNGGGQGHFYARREFANFGFGINYNNLSENNFQESHTQPILRSITCRNSVIDKRRHIRVNGNNSGSTNNVIVANFTNDRLTIGQEFSGHIGEHIEYNSYVPLSSVEQVENDQSVYFSIAQPCLANSVPPTAPSQLFASSLSSTQASVSFLPSSTSGSRAMNYYEVTSTPGNIKATGTTSPITVQGLTAGVTYSFEVKAVNFCDETAAGVSNTIVLGQMNAPSNVSTQKGIAEGSAVITFTAPTFTNNQTITGYTVTSAPDNISVTGNSSPITITGLSDIKKYTFTVVANTATTSSLPSLVSNSIYTHTQILNDLPTPITAFALRKLLSTYNGPAIQVRRNDNTTQNIGFLPNGELDEAALSAFVGSGNGFVTTWYDQSGNQRNLTQTTYGDQPLIVSNGVLTKKNNQLTLRFSSSDKLYITSPLVTTRVFHSVWNAAGPFGAWGYLVRFFPSNGNGGIMFTDNNTTVVSVNNNYAQEPVFINGLKTNDFAPLNQLKSLTTNSNSFPMANNISGFTLCDGLDYFGNGNANISNFMMFANNLSDADRNKLEKRQSACFELGF